jgi:hypothetical protein
MAIRRPASSWMIPEGQEAFRHPAREGLKRETEMVHADATDMKVAVYSPATETSR